MKKNIGADREQRMLMPYDSVAFRFVAGNHHPDHDTKSGFIKRFLPEVKVWFKEIDKLLDLATTKDESEKNLDLDMLQWAGSSK